MIISYEVSEECYTNYNDTVSYMYWAVFKVNSKFNGDIHDKEEIAKCNDKYYADKICALLNSEP